MRSARWTRQPPYPVGIDWGNPITRGLLSAVWAQSAGPYDAVTGRQCTSTSPTLAVGPGGRAWARNGSSIQSQLGAIAQSGATLEYVVHLNNSLDPTASSSVIAKVNATIYDPLFTVATYHGAGQFLTSTIYNPLGTNAATLTAPIAMQNNRDYIYGVASGPGVRGSLCWLDGQVVTTTTQMAATSDAIVHWPVSGSYPNGLLQYGGYLWGRPLSPVERVSLARNPWQLFARSARRTYILPSSGASAALNAALSAPTADITAVLDIAGTVGATLPAPALDATAALDIGGTVGATLPPPTADIVGSASTAITAALGASLAAPALSAFGSLEIQAQVAAALPAPTLVSSGWRPAQLISVPRWTIGRAAARLFTAARRPRTFIASRAARLWSVNLMSIRFPIKGIAEAVPLTFDFALELPTGVTLVGPPTVSVAVTQGTDPSPAAILNGAAGLNGAASAVVQAVQAGLDGVDYTITCTCGTSQSGLTLTRVGLLPVRADPD